MSETPVDLIDLGPLVEGDEDVPLHCADVTWVPPPCLYDQPRPYYDDRWRLQLKMQMPGLTWDVRMLAKF